MGSPPLFFLNVYPIKHPESERTLIIPPTHSTVLYLIRIFLIIQFRVRAIFTAQVFTHSSSRSRNWIASQNISSERQNVNCKLKRGGKWRLQLVYSAYGLNAPNTKCIQIFGFQRYVLYCRHCGAGGVMTAFPFSLSMSPPLFVMSRWHCSPTPGVSIRKKKLLTTATLSSTHNSSLLSSPSSYQLGSAYFLSSFCFLLFSCVPS